MLQPSPLAPMGLLERREQQARGLALVVVPALERERGLAGGWRRKRCIPN